jgi:predicted Zn-dependent peptidase
MITKQYEKVKETLHSETLENGLQVFVLPKAGFTKTFVTFTTKFGSVDHHFRISETSDIVVPDGLAHFLEHKMFAEPDGDVFTKFAANGASANAFTSFDRTAYLFSCSNQLAQNLEILLDFVQNPYFTQANVDKERGIIDQEIAMYQDNPDWRIYFELLSSLFVKSPMKIDIIGTSATIAQITPQSLYECYHAFYHPSNMCLFAVGAIEPHSFIALVKANQARKTFSPKPDISRIIPEEPDYVAVQWKEITMPVSEPKCLLGFKELHTQKLEGGELLKRECALQIMFQLLFAPSSTIYQSLYSEQLIHANFSTNVTVKNDLTYSMIGGDTPNPEKLITRIFELVEHYFSKVEDRVGFERMKRKAMGALIRMFNSPSAIAGQFTAYHFQNSDFFELLTAYERLNFDECLQFARNHFNDKHHAVCVVRDGVLRDGME